MSLTHGMDTAGGAAAGQQLDLGSQQVADLARRLDDALHDFEWTGRDAEAARDAWSSSHRPALEQTGAHLAELAVLLRREAAAQDAASGTGAGGVPGGTGVVPAASAVATTSLLGRLGILLTGFGRAFGHLGGYLGKIGDLLTGREDWSVAEVAASAIASNGAAIGAVKGAWEGRDLRWFGEGPGVAGTPVPAGGAHPLVPPRDLPSLMAGVTSAYAVGAEPGSTGDVRITRIDRPGRPPAYVVAIPGTEKWDPGALANPHDTSANVALMAGEPSAAAQSVVRAMEAAGIQPGSQTLITAHSQAGIAAAMLASDPAFVQRFGVQQLMTYGSPIDHVQLAPGVDAIQLQHGRDVVPRLDLGGYSTGTRPYPNAVVPTVDLPAVPGGLKSNHDDATYAESVRTAMAGDTPQGQALRAFQERAAPFLLGTDGRASAVDVPVRRDPTR